MKVCARRVAPVLLLTTVLAVGGAQADVDQSKCTDKGPWVEFRNSALTEFFEPTLMGNKDPDAAGRQDVAAKVHAAVGECRKKIGKDHLAKFNACVSRLEKLTEVLGRSGLGLDPVSNDNYFKTHAAKMTVPDALNDKALFEALLGAHLTDPESLKKVMARIDEMARTLKTEIIAVPYVTSSTPAIDNRWDRFGRLILWLQGKDGMSHYVQFTLNAAPKSTSSGPRVQASVVNVETGVGAYVFDLERDNKQFKLVPSKGGNNQKCFECHASGVLSIHPFDPDEPNTGREIGGELVDSSWVKTLNKDYSAALVKLNNQIKKDHTSSGVVGAPVPKLADGMVVPDPWAYQGENPACTTAGKAAVKSVLPLNKSEADTDWWNYWTSWNPLAKRGGYVPLKPAMDCVYCHKDRGSAVFDRQSLKEITDKYVGLGFMPPKKTMAAADARKAAADCVVSGYYAANGILGAWLKEPACQ